MRFVPVWRIESVDRYGYTEFSGFYEALADARRAVWDQDWRREHDHIKVVRYQAIKDGCEFWIRAFPMGETTICRSDGKVERLESIGRHVEEEL